MSDEPKITFELDGFNKRRYMRTKHAARVKVLEDGKLVGLPWMDPIDIKLNIEEFGEDQGLIDAYNAFPGHKYKSKT